MILLFSQILLLLAVAVVLLVRYTLSLVFFVLIIAHDIFGELISELCNAG